MAARPTPRLPNMKKMATMRMRGSRAPDLLQGRAFEPSMYEDPLCVRSITHTLCRYPAGGLYLGPHLPTFGCRRDLEPYGNSSGDRTTRLQNIDGDELFGNAMKP